MGILLGMAAHAQAGGGSGVLELPFWEWPAPAVRGSVQRYETTQIDGAPAGRVWARLGRGRGEARGAYWYGEAQFALPQTSRLRSINWDTRFRLSLQVRIGEALVSARHHRARLYLVDAQGRRQYLPNDSIGSRPAATQGWIRLSGRPATSLPIPLGFTDAGFRADQIVALGLNIEAGGFEGEDYQDWIELRDLQLEDLGTQTVAHLDPDPNVLAEEPLRAQRLTERWRQRFGTAPHAGRSIYGVNLAWPGATAPNGQFLHLYGSFLEARSRWFGEYWDLARNPAVEAALRADFQGIRQLFGPQSIVRVFLFADLRAGIEFDAHGRPLRFTATALQSLDRLFSLAAEEQVVLMPCLFDFLMVDGKANPPEYPGDYAVGEAPQLILDPEARAAMVRLIGQLAARYKNHSALLAWDIMNEPENAVAVVTPERWVSLQTFLRDAVDAVHAEGELATVGHRNPVDARDHFRGVLRTSLGQAHYYPYLETRPAPFALDLDQASVFGQVPGGWGEVPAREGRIDADFAQGRAGNAAYFLFWSWRGDDPGADGFRVRALATEIASALRRHGPIPYLFTMDDFPMWFVPEEAERRAAYASYRRTLQAHGTEGVLFVNGAGLDDGANPTAEWSDLRGFLEDGHFLGNHGAHHKPLTEVSWRDFWQDTQAGITSLDQGAPAWRVQTHYYRFPNSEWGTDPEFSCRKVTGELGAQILPVTTDLMDYTFGYRYHQAATPAARAEIRAEASRLLEQGAARVRARRELRGERPSLSEVMIIHSSRFARDHLDSVLTELEQLGVRWVNPRQADLADYQATATQCVPACRHRRECR